MSRRPATHLLRSTVTSLACAKHSGPRCSRGANGATSFARIRTRSTYCAGGDNAICPALRLEDASSGLAAYILDRQVHLLRLSDGADAVVAYGTIARFTDTGLVYADGARIHLVPFDRLPLR